MRASAGIRNSVWRRCHFDNAVEAKAGRGVWSGVVSCCGLSDGVGKLGGSCCFGGIH